MSERVVIVMRLPDRALSPNSKAWTNGAKRKKARLSNAQRDDAHKLTLEALNSRTLDWTAARLVTTWYCGNSRRQCQPDEDNADASLKWARDGIAAALGINDRNFTGPKPVILCDPANPRVEICVEKGNG